MTINQTALNKDGTETVQQVELPDDFFKQTTQPTVNDRLSALEAAMTTQMGV